jgi:hypothetical protein
MLGEVEVDEEVPGTAAALGEAPVEAGLPRAPADLSSQFEQLRRRLVKLSGGGGSVRRGEWMVCRREEPIASIYRVERWPRGAEKERPWRGSYGERKGKARTAMASWCPGDARRAAGAAKA